MNELERRLALLEKSNRRWRRTMSITIALVLIGLIAGSKKPNAAPDVFRAKRIEVLNSRGKPAIVLQADEDSSSLILSAKGEDGERAVSLFAHSDGASLMLMHDKESPHFSVFTDESGAALSLFDGRGKHQQPRCILLRTTNPSDRYQGGSSITLARNGGHKQDDIDASLSVRDPAGKLSLMLGESFADEIKLQTEDGDLQFSGVGKQ